MGGWRTLIVQSDARLSLHQGNLHLERTDGQMSLPLDDLDVVLLESPRGMVSHAVLAHMAARGIVLMVVDEKHTPCGVLLPYAQNPRTPNLLSAQIALTEPFKKRVWQRIVREKIMNASRCLEVLGRNGSGRLAEIARTVQSGDSTGREAYAAREYFKYLAPDFRRRSDSPIAAALDYGYAVVRALLARSLASAGLQCALGVGHRSSTNPFNLADDFVEVFRPLVDLRVFLRPPERELTSEYRAYLVSTVRLECSIQGSTYTMSTAAAEVAASYARAVIARDYRKVLLPQLTGPDLRGYE